MFDCPEQSHTSPTSTSGLRTTVVPSTSCTSSSKRPSPQSLVSSVTCQRPESDAVASRVCPAKLTRTVAPAFALPQMGTACDLQDGVIGEGR